MCNSVNFEDLKNRAHRLGYTLVAPSHNNTAHRLWIGDVPKEAFTSKWELLAWMRGFETAKFETERIVQTILDNR